MTGLLAPLPNVSATADWPVPDAARDSRHDFRYEFSLSAGPEFDTDSMHDTLTPLKDPHPSSPHDLHRTISTSDDTSVLPHVLPESVPDLKQLRKTSMPHLHPFASDDAAVAAFAHSLPLASDELAVVAASLPFADSPTAETVAVAAAACNVRPPTVTPTKRKLACLSPRTPVSASASASASAVTSNTIAAPSAIPIAPKCESVEERPAPPGQQHASAKESEMGDGSEMTNTHSFGNSSKQSNETVNIRPSTPTSPTKPAKSIAKKKLSVKKGATSSLTPVSSSLTLSVGTSVAGSAGPGSGGLSHTKLCRDRLNNMFERLRHTLPPAPPGVEVKHKAQVLDYAIMVLKTMVERTSQLEVELAVSSNKATMEWITKLIYRVDSFPDTAEEVMRMFAKRRGWLHAELWTVGKRAGHEESSELEGSVVLQFCSAVSNELADGPSLAGFSKESSSLTFRPPEGVQGRVWSSMRPEWVTGLSDLESFRRTGLARKYGVKVCLGVPITITGKIEGIMCFYDVKHRPYDTQCLELAMRLAWALGNAIGGKRAKIDYDGSPC